MTDLHALITELANELDHNRQCLLDDRRVTHPLADKARAVLTEPEQGEPTDNELEKEFGRALLNLPGDSMNATAVAFARAVLARWGK